VITVYHPNTLKDPEMGPIVQKQIQAGTAVLSEKMCEDCAELQDKNALLQGNLIGQQLVVDEWREIVFWVRRHSEWLEAALVFFAENQSFPKHEEEKVWTALREMEKLPPIARIPLNDELRKLL
jgi:hypothetical protein